jgi:hypothetical protein
MTTEERLARIEHLSAGWLEERKRDHEEYMRRWRDIQENADATWKAIDRHAVEWRREAADMRAAMTARDQREEARGKELDGRIEKLVSAIGELIGEMRSGRAK